MPFELDVVQSINIKKMEALVLDNGGYYCRIGRSGEDTPGTKFRSVVSIDDHQVAVVGKDDANNCMSPIERGLIVDWERMELVWKHGLKAINCNPKNYAICLSETLFNPRMNREMMMQVLFESLQFPHAQVAVEGVLNVYASGRGTALSVTSGDGVSQVVPIIEGYLVTPVLFRSDFGGSDITLYLMKLLKIEFN